MATTTAIPWNDDDDGVNDASVVVSNLLLNATTDILDDLFVLPITRPPYSDRQNRFLQCLITVAPIPSWIGSGLILYVLWKERRTRVLQHGQTYHRLILGMSFYDFTLSLHFTIFGGNWTIPKLAADWVVGAHADTFFWCNVSGFFFYQYYGTILYSSCLMLFYIMDIYWSWSKQFIERRIEPFMHVISNLVPWLNGILAVATHSIVPHPQIPGICSIFEWPPHCETENNPVPCTHGGSREGTFISSMLGIASLVIWMVIMVGSLIALTTKVWAVEQRLRNYASGALVDDHLPMTRQTAVRGILYMTSFFVCNFVVIPLSFPFWDLNEEYRHVHFALALFACSLMVNLGFFNALIYLQPYFAELTLPNGTLWFLHPICQVLGKCSCCVAFWSCRCCHCCVKTALESPLFQSPATPSIYFGHSSHFTTMTQETSNTSKCCKPHCGKQEQSPMEKQCDSTIDAHEFHLTRSRVSSLRASGIIPLVGLALDSTQGELENPEVPAAMSEQASNANQDEEMGQGESSEQRMNEKLVCTEQGAASETQKAFPITENQSVPVECEHQTVLDNTVQDWGWDQAPIYTQEGCFHETIVAPAGPLRIKISASPEGPVVCSVSHYSALYECVYERDIIVAIDNISTRQMAIENVSALLAATQVLARRITVEREMPGLAILECEKTELVCDSEKKEEEVSQF